MRFWRWIPTVALLVLLALPAFPPLIQYVLSEGLKAGGFKGQWGGVGGYLLTGIHAKDVQLEGGGIKVQAAQLHLSYSLLSLARKELPLRIFAQDGVASIGWDTLIPSKPPGPPGALKLRVDELRLENIQVSINEGKRFPIPTLKAQINGNGPYQVRVELPEGKISAEVRRTGREFEAWDLQAKGELRAARYWYSGIEGGTFTGHWVVNSKGVRGDNQISGGVVRFPGPITASAVAGPVRFDGNVVSANLTGYGLGGPLKASGTVNLRRQRYSFQVEGNPTLPALAANWNLKLPVEGSGPLVLEGHGWRELILTGRYRGVGRLLGEPLNYQGTLEFDKVFRLDAAAEGRFFDRSFSVEVSLVGSGYKVGLTDSLGSQLQLRGAGSDTTGSGTLVWPKPLQGNADLKFESTGSRWRAAVTSEGVGLPAAKPFRLSGSLSGNGNQVAGQLGPLGVDGSWSNLGLRLSSLELLVGSLSGSGALRDGRLTAQLNYASPYTQFPLEVRQEGKTWRLSNRYADGSYQNGVFSLSLKALPLQLGEALALSGNLRYADTRLSGSWDLQSPHARVQGVLEGLGTRYQGQLRTPLGDLPLSGTADSSGVRATLDTLSLTASGTEGVRIRGPLKLGVVSAQADLSLKGGAYLGSARLSTPWLQADLEGQGRTLYATTRGYAELSGPLWPTPALAGQLTLPFRGAVEVPPLPLEVDREGVRLQGGSIRFQGDLPFQLSLPLRIQGQSARLEASGNLQGGRVQAFTPYGSLAGTGPWSRLSLSGAVQAAGYSGQLSGQANLLEARYTLGLDLPQLEGSLRAQGKGTELRYSGQFQGGRLSLSGEYRQVSGDPLEGLRLQAVARSFDTRRLGFPAQVSGRWSDQGGQLRLESPYGQVLASGNGLLGPLKVEVQSPYGQLQGRASTEALELRGSLRLPYLSGSLAVQGPWERLEASGSGEYRLPYLEPRAWRLSADVLKQTWQLEGPLQLEGRGLEYRGQVDWPYTFQGRSGTLRGQMEGRSLNLEAQFQTEYSGIPLSAELRAQGTDLHKLIGAVHLPEGQIQIANARARFDLETRSLARAFNVEVAGRIAGNLNLEGNGEASGHLQVYGQEVELAYRDRVVSAFLPSLSAGLRLQLSPPLQLTGLGDLSGSVRLSEPLSGRLTYPLGQTRLEAEFSGPHSRPGFQLSASGPWGQALGRGSYRLEGAQGQASLEVSTPYAKTQLELSSRGTTYQAMGPLETLQYLKQRGPLRISGDGARWSAVWTAPLQLQADGRGAEILSAQAQGQGTLEAAGRSFSLSGELSNQGEDFRGLMTVSSPSIALELRGQAGGVRASGQAYGVSVAAQVSRRGDLGGTLSYAQSLASSRLSLEATLKGSVLKPLLQGQGSLAGKGAQIALSFAYDGQVQASALGPGLQAEYTNGVLKAQAETDLEPFLGLPLKLKTAGEGPLETLELPLKLTGPQLEASGILLPMQLRASLSGTYQNQGFELSYDRILQARLSGPYLTGVVRYDQTPSGSLLLDLPVPGGRLVGSAEIATGRLSLAGQGSWSGALNASLAQGWSQPTLWQVEADLGGPVGLEGRFGLDLSPLRLNGSGQVTLPGWGRVALSAQDTQVRLQGAEGLEPLKGTLRLNPLQLSWSYGGALPKGLGQLEASGTYPGLWASGTYQALGQTLVLQGQDTQLSLSGSGLQARLTPEGVEAKLDNFNLSSLRLNGNLSGPWSALQASLDWSALGRGGQIQARWETRTLQASLAGDLTGSLRYAQGWSGVLSFREGQASLSGDGLPILEGQVLGFGVRLAYPSLEVFNPTPSGGSKPPPPTLNARTASSQVLQGAGGAPAQHLSLNLAERSASGSLEVRGVTVQGQGRSLEAAYPLAEGQITAGFNLETYALTLAAPGLGQGNLVYSGGKLSGRLDAALYGLELSLKGEDQQVSFSGSHPATEWLPWGDGTLSGRVGLDGTYQATYTGASDKQPPQVLELQGKALEARLKAKGPWLNGGLEYGSGGAWAGSLSVNLPLPALDSNAALQLQGKGELSAQGKVEGGVGTLNLSASLGGSGPKASLRFSDLNLSEIPLLASRIPYLEGRASGQAEYSADRATFSLSSPGLSIKNDGLSLATRLEGHYQGGVFQADLTFDQVKSEGLFRQDTDLGSSRSRIHLQSDGQHLSGEASASAFPLHWLLSAWVGDLSGQAYWTGKASFDLDLRNAWASKGVFVGQNLRFEGGGDALSGQAVLRFEGERFYIDELALAGKGTWKGSGYWGRNRSNLRLDLENTTFTPVLQVIPSLKPYAPEGSGTLRLRSDGQVFDLSLENFRFKLGPVRAETPRATLQVGKTATATGRLTLTAPYPAVADLSGEGDAEGFTVSAKGSANLPLLSPNEPFTLSFSYPSYVLDVRLVNQQARLNGTLFPRLALALQGPVPVSYPQYFLLDGLVNTNLVLNYTDGVYRVLGSVEVIRARLGLPQGQQEVSIPASSPPSSPGQSPPIPVQFVNVEIQAERGILIQEPLAQGELAGDLYLNGDASNPYLSGEVVPLRGSFRLWNREFTLHDRSSTERSYARFSPDNGILPEIQITADTQVQDQAKNETVKIYLTLKGQFVRQNGKIKINLDPTFTAQTSSGPLSQAEIYALLLLGRSDLSVLPNDIAQSGIQGVVQNFLLGQLETELSKVLGLDQVKVDIPLLNGGKVEETKFTIGKYLSPELFFAYSVDLRGYQTVYAEYRQGDYSFRFSSDLIPYLRPTFSLGYSIRPIGADLTLDISTPSSSDSQTDGFRFSVGLTFRF